MALGEIKRREQKGHTALSIINLKPATLTRARKSPTIKVDIRIQEDLWTEFVNLCREEGTSASEERRGYIRSRVQ